MRLHSLYILLCIAALVLMPLCSSKLIHAQPAKEWSALQVGDTVPDFAFQLVNGDKTTGRFSDYLGKHILLDFWSTWCTTCLIKIPLLDSLQKEYADKLEIVLINTAITGDNEERLNGFFAKREKATGEKFPFPSIAYDTIAEKLFPYRMLPHCVFISPQGVVQSFAEYLDITRNTIQSFIKNEKLAVREKIDRNIEHNKPLFFNGNAGEPQTYIYRSLLTGYVSGLPGAAGLRKKDTTIVTKTSQTNMPVLSLYKLAYPELVTYPKNRQLFFVKDIYKYRPAISEDYDIRNFLYCYELLTPPIPFKHAKQLMKEDLERYFGLIVSEEKRELHCLIVKRSKRMRIKNEVNSKSENNLDDTEAGLKFIRNQPLSVLIKHLDANSSIPVIDKTKYTENITMELPANLEDRTALKEALKKYGFELKEEKRKVDCIVITEPEARL